MRGLHPEPRARRAGRLGDRRTRRPCRTPRLTVPAPTPEPTFLIYVVKPGDVLEKIAKRYKTTVASIGYWNRARYKTLDPDSAAFAPDTIRVGWKLRIHPGQTTDTDYEDPTPIPPPESPEASRRLAVRLPVGLTARPTARGGRPAMIRWRNCWVRSCSGLRKIRSGGPSSRIRPPSRKQTRSAMSRAKPISWVAMTIVMPPAARLADDVEHLGDELRVQRAT